jgi:hypothetical protein
MKSIGSKNVAVPPTWFVHLIEVNLQLSLSIQGTVHVRHARLD